MGDSKMLFLFTILADDGMDYSFENIVFRNYAFHVLDEIVCFGSLVILEVENDQVKSCLWNDINKWRQNLKSILSTSEHNQVVS